MKGAHFTLSLHDDVQAFHFGFYFGKWMHHDVVGGPWRKYHLVINILPRYHPLIQFFNRETDYVLYWPKWNQLARKKDAAT